MDGTRIISPGHQKKSKKTHSELGIESKRVLTGVGCGHKQAKLKYYLSLVHKRNENYLAASRNLKTSSGIGLSKNYCWLA